jgi:hypothetical protein
MFWFKNTAFGERRRGEVFENKRAEENFVLTVDKHKQQRSVELLYLDTDVGSAANSDHAALGPLAMYCCQQL